MTKLHLSITPTDNEPSHWLTTMEQHLADYFQNYFDTVPAKTDFLREAVYRLRYQVYCLETGFEEHGAFSNGLERDNYDDCSEHYLVLHRATQQYAATTRLILPDWNNLARPYPIESHAQFEQISPLENIPRDRLAEVSRFCVSQQFKRREGEANTLAGIGPATPAHEFNYDGGRRIFANCITLGLIACLVRMSIKHGITHWYAFMELALARLLRNFGIDFIPLGPLVDYHGKRRPYFIKLADLLAGVRATNIEVWWLLTNHGTFWEESDPDTLASLYANDGQAEPGAPAKI